MNARNTILTKEEIMTILPHVVNLEETLGTLWWELTKKGLEEQAEVSFKAGILEVVNWILANSYVDEKSSDDEGKIYPVRGFIIPERTFDDQLKGWEL